MKLKSLFVALCYACLAVAGCKKQSPDEEFSLRYFGVTQIGPNLTVSLTPYYNNGEPSQFAFSGITRNGEPYTGGTEFSINEQSGVVTISGNEQTVPGMYKVGVSCVALGKSYVFAGAIEVEFLRGIPEGIKVTPAYADIDIDNLEEGSEAELPAPVVTTEGEHVKISAYRIANVRFEGEPVDNVTNPHFAISQEGVISIVKGAPYKVGTYSVDLKLNTACYGADSQEGFFADAFTMRVVSAPKAVSYSPDNGVIEEELDGMQTSHTSPVPVLTGSADEVVWSIANVTPATDKIAIDPATGVLSIAKGHGLAKDQTFVVDVNVRNKWSSPEGLTVEGAYSIEVVEFIYPIEGYGYTAASKKMATAWSVSPDPSTKYVRSYAFAEPEADYTKSLSLNTVTGELTALKGNSLPKGKYDVKIAASNGKQEPVVATFALEIVENPYYFTYFAYGNNLDLSETQTSGASQFRVASAAELTALSAPVKYTDLADVSKAEWKISAKNRLSGTTVSTDGTITFNGYTAAQCGVAFVTATTTDPEDLDNSFSVTVPVFVDMPSAVGGTTVTFTPFVLRVNPAKGGRSTMKAEHPGVDDDKFILDYRRTFNYWNISGVRTDGTALESGTLNTNSDNAQYFLQHLWTAFGKASGLSSGYGSKNAISFYNGASPVAPKTQKQLDVTPVYVDNSEGENRFTVMVNPGLWYDDGWADGVFLAQMTYVTDGNLANLNSGSQRFPLALWLDKDFE